MKYSKNIKKSKETTKVIIILFFTSLIFFSAGYLLSFFLSNCYVDYAYDYIDTYIDVEKVEYNKEEDKIKIYQKGGREVIIR